MQILGVEMLKNTKERNNDDKNERKAKRETLNWSRACIEYIELGEGCLVKS